MLGWFSDFIIPISDCNNYFIVDSESLRKSMTLMATVNPLSLFFPLYTVLEKPFPITSLRK